MKLRLILALSCTLTLLGPTAIGDERAGPIRVTVLDPGGTPVAGARVSVRAGERGFARWFTPQRLALGVTSAQGVADLAGVMRAQPLTLVVTAPDARWREFADTWQTDWTPTDTTIRMQRANVLRGVVRGPSGQGVPYAIVHCEVGAWVGGQSTRADGTFVFENLPAGNVCLHAELENPEGPPASGPKVRCAIDGREVVLALPQAPAQPPPCLLVRITTPAGRPVANAGADLYGHWVSGSSSSSYSGNAFVSGCAVRVFHDRAGMTVTVAGACTELGERLPYGPVRTGRLPGPPGEVDVRLPAGLTIEGRVLDGRGKGAPGVEVRAVPARGTRLGSDSTSWTSTPHGFGVSGTDGAFVLEGLEERNYRLEALATSRFLPSNKGANVAVGKRFPIEATQDTPEARGVPAAAGAKNVVVYVRNAAQPTVTVVGDDGKPLSGARVSVMTIPTDEFFGPSQAWPDQQTDARGEAHFAGLDPELFYELTVSPPAHRGELLPWNVKQWRPADERITLGKPRTIAGVVQTPDGAPIPEANLCYELANGPLDARGECKAGPDGRFEWKGLRPGSYEVTAWPPDPYLGRIEGGRGGCEHHKSIEAGNETAVLTVSMPSKLVVEIPGWTSKLGCKEARLVRLDDDAASPLEVQIPKSGRLTFEDLDWREAYLFWVGPLKEGRNVYVNPAYPTVGTLVAPVRLGHKVSGRVAAPRGTRKKRIYVVFPGFEIRGKLDARSRFEIEGLPPGPWRLRACGERDGKELEKTVEIRAGEDIEIQLEE